MKALKILTFFVLCFPFTCLAQADTTGNPVLQKFEMYSAAHLTEKVYLHFDRPYYAAGDTMYYKAYLTLGATHALSALSGVLHVALIDNDSNKALRSEKLQVTNGVAWGDFALPDTLTHGSYRIRAYTNLMRNNGDASFFEKDITIVPVRNKKDIPVNVVATAKPAKPDIQFFPEGGTLVNGIASRIAFKAINTNGLGIAVKGEIVDHAGKGICSFSSVHLGMGSFYLAPVAGERYKAAISYANGDADIVNLPIAAESGITLSTVNDSAWVASVIIAASAAYFDINQGKTCQLTVYSGGTLTSIPFRLDSTVVTILLYKRKLHTGITRLTLFSPEQDPVCERLLYIDNNDQLNLTIGTDKPDYDRREKGMVNISAKDRKGLPVQGDFSVAVTNEGKMPVDSNSESTILNYLLLSSDLKGNIEQPNYYFGASGEAFSDLDLLMLTQGYRSFEWKTVLNNTDTIPQYHPEKLLSINGTVKTLNGKPVPHAEIALVGLRQMVVRDTTADSNGNFAFNNLSITDTAKLLLRAGKGNKSWRATVLREDVPPIEKRLAVDTAQTYRAIKPAIAAEMKKDYLQYGNMKTGIMLKQVEIHENLNPEHLVELQHSDNLNGPGRADQVIMGDQLVGCPNIEDCLINLAHVGVRISGKGIYSNHTPVALSGGTQPMAVYIDGVKLEQNGQTGNAFHLVNPSDIYSIEILASYRYIAIYGSNAANGAIIITMKTGGEYPPIIVAQPGLTTYEFRGFYPARLFYAPKYDAQQPISVAAYNRTTVSWKPLLLTGKDGSASFDFYNSNKPGNYRVVVEGMDADGDIGRKIYHYTVE